MDLGFDEHGPLLVLASRDEGGGGRIELGFDEDGPYLKLIKPVAGFQPKELKLSVDQGLVLPQFLVPLARGWQA